MSNDKSKGVYQTAGETAIEMFAAKLRNPSAQQHYGFDNPNKAMMPELATREELNLGYMSDRELAAEVDTLNGYMREELEMYDRGTHFFNILDAAQQRIRHLSGRLAKAEGKVVEGQNVQTLGRLHPIGKGDWEGDTLSLEGAQVFPGLNDIITHPGGGTPLPWHVTQAQPPHSNNWFDKPKPPHFPLNEPHHVNTSVKDLLPRPEGAPAGEYTAGCDVTTLLQHGKEVCGSSSEEKITASKAFLENSGITLQVSPPGLLELKPGHAFDDLAGDVNSIMKLLPAVSTIMRNGAWMASRGFNITWGDFKVNVDDRSTVLTRIGVLVDRACFKMGMLSGDKLSTLASRIGTKHPEVSNQLILACFEAANPEILGASTETLNQLYQSWLEMIGFIDPRPSKGDN